MDRDRSAREGLAERLVWLFPAACLTAIAGGVLLIRLSPERVFGWALGGIFALAFAWVLISTLWPGRADRACPACGEESVERLDPTRAVGKRCAACGWTDDSASSWMIAEEEEEALEHLVLGRRGPLDRAKSAD